MNALSLTNHYGAPTRKVALKLLENGLIDFIGSDAHHVEHIEKIKDIKLSNKHLNMLGSVIENTKNTFSM